MPKTTAKMKCPYCDHIWGLTQQQEYWNTKFRCPDCKQYNYGSTKMLDGVLIGVKYNPNFYLQ